MELSWVQVVQSFAKVDRDDGRSLLLGVINDGPGRFICAAIESSTAVLRGNDVRLFFDDHAHDVITKKARRVSGAMKAGERYARRWRRNEAAAAPAGPCGCETIPEPAPRTTKAPPRSRRVKQEEGRRRRG